MCHLWSDCLSGAHRFLWECWRDQLLVESENSGTCLVYLDPVALPPPVILQGTYFQNNARRSLRSEILRDYHSDHYFDVDSSRRGHLRNTRVFDDHREVEITYLLSVYLSAGGQLSSWTEGEVAGCCSSADEAIGERSLIWCKIWITWTEHHHSCSCPLVLHHLPTCRLQSWSIIVNILQGHN